MLITLAILLFIFALVCCALTLMNLPGNWLMLLAAGAYWLWAPDQTDARLAIHGGIVLALLALACLGELLELLAGALGAKKGGGSKRGAVLAVIGSFVGSIIGGLVGVPFLPTVIGTVIAIVLFAGLGATGGAMVGEAWKGRSFDESWKVGKSAFWGRLLGTAAKIMVAFAMVTVLTLALLTKIA